MAIELGRRNDIDPLVSYAFEVHFGETIVTRFSGVDGLNSEVEMIEYRDSASPNEVQYRQGRMKPARVTFKRGVAVAGGMDFLAWLQETEISKKDVYVTIGRFGRDKGIVENEITWWLHDCKPVKWSLGSLEGNSNNALIETLEVVVSKVTKK